MPHDKIQNAMSGSLELEIRFDGSTYNENAKDSPHHQPISCNIGEVFEKNLPGLGGKVKVLNVIKVLFSLSFIINYSKFRHVYQMKKFKNILFVDDVENGRGKYLSFKRC